MFRRNCLLLLLIGLLVFAPTASAQECRQPVVQERKKAEAPIQREKPYAELEPTPRPIAPRDLPLVYQKEADRSADAAEVISRFPNKGLIDNAKAIAVFPGVKKAALGLGVRWGSGLLTKRGADGRWLPPSYVEIGGGNLGLQLGFQSTDLLLVFTNDDAVDALLKGKLTLNADASAAAGPIGRNAQAGIPIIANSAILSFTSRSKGLFAGVSLDGAAITINDTSNHRVYGKYITGTDILMDQRVEVNEAVAPFLNALETYSPGRQANTTPTPCAVGCPNTTPTPCAVGCPND
jgi:lipid-binding SYLF domain-containing protein